MAGSVLLSGGPLHIISYGTLLGSTFFHSFINGPVMFKTIDRPSFSAVQQKIFPGYFAMQTAIPIVLALTFPGNHLSGIPSGIYGVLDQSNRCSSLLPIAAMFATGLANLAVLLPATLKVMKARQAQVKRDGKEWDAQGHQSEEMRALNKKFGILHAVSSLLNLGTFLAAAAYGVTLGSRIQSFVN